MPANRIIGLLVLAAVVIASDARPAQAQFMSARRMAMGGVTSIHGGPASDLANVAARAVPPDPRERVHSISLPIGIIPVLQVRPALTRAIRRSVHSSSPTSACICRGISR